MIVLTFLTMGAVLALQALEMNDYGLFQTILGNK